MCGESAVYTDNWLLLHCGTVQVTYVIGEWTLVNSCVGDHCPVVLADSPHMPMVMNTVTQVSDCVGVLLN